MVRQQSKSWLEKLWLKRPGPFGIHTVQAGSRSPHSGTRRHTEMNNLKVFLMMAGLTALLGAVGSLIGGQSGLVMALVLAAGVNFFADFPHARVGVRLYGAPGRGELQG